MPVGHDRGRQDSAQAPASKIERTPDPLSACRWVQRRGGGVYSLILRPPRAARGPPRCARPARRFLSRLAIRVPGPHIHVAACDAHRSHSRKAPIRRMLSEPLCTCAARLRDGSAPRSKRTSTLDYALFTFCGTPFTAELASRNAHRRARSSLGRSMSRLDHSTLRPCRWWPSHRRRQVPLGLP